VLGVHAHAGVTSRHGDNAGVAAIVFARGMGSEPLAAVALYARAAVRAPERLLDLGQVRGSVGPGGKPKARLGAPAPDPEQDRRPGGLRLGDRGAAGPFLGVAGEVEHSTRGEVGDRSTIVPTYAHPAPVLHQVPRFLEGAGHGFGEELRVRKGRAERKVTERDEAIVFKYRRVE
jgi:hypothetical protein